MKNMFLLVLLNLYLFGAAQMGMKDSVAENHTITVVTDHLVGEVYNLWDVRVINAPELWGRDGFAEKIKSTTKHTKYINNIRTLGGKNNGTCEWYEGVDDKGEPICDFAPFLGYLKAQKSVGFIPWIVLDNVPHKMSNKPTHQYGNTSPPNDYDLWFKYIQKFITSLVDEFGIEEVSSWRFRVGTEPDLFPGHWSGTKEEFFKHYDYTVAAVESVIKKPWIGPGNMLMWNGAQTGEKGGRWGFEILKHCAEGTNYYTGKTGTRIDFFSHSVYALEPHPFLFEENMKKVKAEFAKYPSIKNIDYEIHEYGELFECLSKGDALSNTEFLVGLYAHTVEVAYKYNVRRIYNWDEHLGMITTYDQIIEGLFQPWTKIMDCLSLMENGQRVEVLKDAQKELKFGAVGAWKDDTFYMLVYSHHDSAEQEFSNNIELTIVGDRFAKNQQWLMDEQLLDKNNGIYIHELYNDIEAEGIEPVATDFRIKRNISGRYGKENYEAAATVVRKNLEKYQKMGEPKLIRDGEKILTTNGKLEFNLQFEGSGYRFISLKPVKN